MVFTDDLFMVVRLEMDWKAAALRGHLPVSRLGINRAWLLYGAAGNLFNTSPQMIKE